MVIQIMNLKSIDTVDKISAEAFKASYYNPCLPVIIKHMPHAQQALKRWDWEYLKSIAGNKKVGIYNNIKSDSRTPINTADSYTSFGEYIDMVSKGPAEWRIFLFNLFEQAPELTKDFEWPDQYVKGFVKKYPMLFVGGQNSITHMHFDIDLSHIMHTQFVGRKRVLLFPYNEAPKLYRKPFEVLSLADFSHYHDTRKSKLNEQAFPATRYANGYEAILEHGDTLFMPAGYWHHMEYIDSGFAMSLRALQPSLSGKLKGLWNLLGMRTIDTVLKRTFPYAWYQYKLRKIEENANTVLGTGHKLTSLSPGS